MIRLVRFNEVQYVASEYEANLLVDQGFVVQDLEDQDEPEKAPAKKAARKPRINHVTGRGVRTTVETGRKIEHLYGARGGSGDSCLYFQDC